MQIWVTIQTDDTDNFDMSSQEVADAMFAAVGGDEDKDMCTVTLQNAPAPPAMIGTPPPPATAEP